MRKHIFWGSIIWVFVLSLCILNHVRYYEIESSNTYYDNSMIGLSINGSPATDFPSKESGLAIDSIHCDKGAEGVWDSSNWMLKVKNVSQNRTKCQVSFVSKYTENILNGTDPILKEGLIPVEISDNGTVTRAKLKDSWYSYENQKWANAVILTNESKEYYEGEEISESDIESYFVWIPRYKYQIFNEGNYIGDTSIMNNVQKINVVFETKDVTPSTGSSVGSWLTHPAFTSFDTYGIWVGKFETGYKGATSTSEAQQNVNDSSKIQIKPNVYSWRNINVANAFYSSYNYKKELDSHMMKNTEWGAVAFLSHSAYGLRGVTEYASVRINNNSAYLTGYAAVREPTTGYTETNISCTTTPETCNEYGTDASITKPWNTTTGVLASTTGNISGIYDMSGGAWEYVMGVMLSSSGAPCVGSDETYTSGFSGLYCYTTGEASGGSWPDTKYYDAYRYGDSFLDYSRRILGDATGEMGPFNSTNYGSQKRQLGSWYHDEAWFVSADIPWFRRGGSYHWGFGTGVFAFGRGYGDTVVYSSFRVVLAV